MPESYNEIIEHPDFAKRDLSSLTLAVGAEPLVAALSPREWRSQSNGYGLTETFTLCTWAEPEEQDGEFRVTHGRALPGIDLRIVDIDTGEPLPTGELGEIAVKGVTFMLGYHKVDDRSEEHTSELQSLMRISYAVFCLKKKKKKKDK